MQSTYSDLLWPARSRLRCLAHALHCLKRARELRAQPFDAFTLRDARGRRSRVNVASTIAMYLSLAAVWRRQAVRP